MQFNNRYQTFSKLDLAQGSAFTTVTTSDQTFDNGNWTGTFTQTPNGTATDMRIEIDWTAGASPLGVPISDPTKIGYSSFDTGIAFGTSNKARIFSIILEFDDISQIVNPTDRLLQGLWMGETTPASRISTTAGAYCGGEITRVVAPVVNYNYGLSQMGSLTQSALLVASGQVVPATISGIYMNVVLSPNGQILIAKMYPYNKAAGVNQTFSSFQPERNNASGTNYEDPTSSNTIKIGCWWGTNKTAQVVGSYYDFTYTLKYAYKELG